ncbi:hypothetical protein VP01_3747g2 [Puccinia sorghi]|uniref:Uncharacterized protein n=1 Tax=Puccinia sorghi TaxID=27349 RepID=A0A0L6UVT1_9BASI|nr:hypothetical protein VP01_3747g2 [Puccinia sorghi]
MAVNEKKKKKKKKNPQLPAVDMQKLPGSFSLIQSHCEYCTVTFPKHIHMQTGGVWMTACLDHAACQLQAVEQVFFACIHSLVDSNFIFPLVAKIKHLICLEKPCTLCFSPFLTRFSHQILCRFYFNIMVSLKYLIITLLQSTKPIITLSYGPWSKPCSRHGFLSTCSPNSPHISLLITHHHTSVKTPLYQRQHLNISILMNPSYHFIRPSNPRIGEFFILPHPFHIQMCEIQDFHLVEIDSLPSNLISQTNISIFHNQKLSSKIHCLTPLFKAENNSKYYLKACNMSITLHKRLQAQRKEKNSEWVTQIRVLLETFRKRFYQFSTHPNSSFQSFRSYPCTQKPSILPQNHHSRLSNIQNPQLETGQFFQNQFLHLWVLRDDESRFKNDGFLKTNNATFFHISYTIINPFTHPVDPFLEPPCRNNQGKISDTCIEVKRGLYYLWNLLYKCRKVSPGLFLQVIF